VTGCRSDVGGPSATEATSAISDINRTSVGRSNGVGLVRVSLTFPQRVGQDLRAFFSYRDYKAVSKRLQASAKTSRAVSKAPAIRRRRFGPGTS
jgi:hypothetical protein